jgi:hypothetical protein
VRLCGCARAINKPLAILFLLPVTSIHPAKKQRHAILGPGLVARHRAVGEPLHNLCGAILHPLAVIEINPESEHVVLILVAEHAAYEAKHSGLAGVAIAISLSKERS